MKPKKKGPSDVYEMCDSMLRELEDLDVQLGKNSVKLRESQEEQKKVASKFKLASTKAFN